MWVCAALYLCKLNIFGFLGLFVGKMLHMKKQPRVLGRGYYYFLIKKIQNNNLKRKKFSLLKTKQSYITDSPMLCISLQFTGLVVQISKFLFNLKNFPIVLKLDLLTSCLLSDHSGVWSEPKNTFFYNKHLQSCFWTWRGGEVSCFFSQLLEASSKFSGTTLRYRVLGQSWAGNRPAGCGLVLAPR